MAKFMKLEIDNSKKSSIASGGWSDPGAKLYDQLLQSYYCVGDLPVDGKSMERAIKEGKYKQWYDFLEEAYLIAPIKDIKNTPYGVTPYTRSGCKYPHHVIKNGKLVVSIPGIKAAYTRAKQAGIFKGKVKEHLERHYKEMGIYQGSTMQINEKIEQNFDLIEGYILEATGIDLHCPTTLYEEHTANWELRFDPENMARHGVGSVKIAESYSSIDELKKEYCTERSGNMDEDDDLGWITEYLMEGVEPLTSSVEGYNFFTEAEEPPSMPDGKPSSTEEQKEEPEKESMPKKTDKAESSKNGVRRKKLYIAFIEWCKEYNPKNTFGSIFDKDAFNVSYPFVPEEMRYFYRLANPMLCVLGGELTFFAASELRKLNSKNSHLNEMVIFAATPNDLRVFNVKDKKIYRGTEENGTIKLNEVIGDTFDTYIQKMINKGDILNAPLEESTDFE